MQKLVKAAKEGTKDGLEKTKAAVKKGRSFIKTKSFCQGLCCLSYTKIHDYLGVQISLTSASRSGVRFSENLVNVVTWCF